MLKKSYSSFLGDIQCSIPLYRESIEWSNTWIDNINTQDRHRGLIIGDSVGRRFRKSLSEVLEWRPIDCICSSHALDDKLFVSLIDSFFDNSCYLYDTIILQLGHHGLVNRQGASYELVDYDRFEKCYGLLVDFLRQYVNNIFCLSVFRSVADKPWLVSALYRRNIPLSWMFWYKEKYDLPDNVIKEEKERRIEHISMSKGINFLNLNQLLNRGGIIMRMLSIMNERLIKLSQR